MEINMFLNNHGSQSTQHEMYTVPQLNMYMLLSFYVWVWIFYLSKREKQQIIFQEADYFFRSGSWCEFYLSGEMVNCNLLYPAYSISYKVYIRFIVLCFIVVVLSYLPISYRVTSLALGQPYGCVIASEVILAEWEGGCICKPIPQSNTQLGVIINY